MNILEALREPALLGGLPAFRDLATWRAWLVFLKAIYGLPMDAAELETFRKHTGRTSPHPGGYPEAVAVVGVQSGKTRIAGALESFEALTGETGTHAVGVGQDHRGAMRVLQRYAREPFETLDAFKAEVVRETADTLELRNGVALSAYPCRPAAVRGIRACVVVVDELAFFTTTDGRPVDTEMLRVARGRLATTGGKLIVLSSPYGQSGALWDLHRKHFGHDDSPTLVWQGSAPDMNPTLPADYLARMESDDPEAYRSEVLGEFRAGIASLFDPEALDACVVAGRRELLPAEGVACRWHFDSTGGRKDAGALCGAYRVGDRIVVDYARRWPAPSNPENVIAEAALAMKPYGGTEVQIDRFAADFPIRAFERHGIRAFVAEKTTSEHYLGLLPIVNAGAIELLDLPELLRELRGLERRRGASGRDRVDHRPGAHDDLAAALAGVVALLAEPAPLTEGGLYSLEKTDAQKHRYGGHDAEKPALAAAGYHVGGGVWCGEDDEDDDLAFRRSRPGYGTDPRRVGRW